MYQLWNPEALSQQPHPAEILQNLLTSSALCLGLGFLTWRENIIQKQMGKDLEDKYILGSRTLGQV